jgi:EAL domain-containing protein (putative c-di-GMP-specific phosphodiesterase class I)
LARRVSDRIAAPTLVNGERVSCSASTGIVWATHGHRAFLDCTADALLRHADRALHAAQQRGSGEIAWSDENGGVDAVAPAGVCAPPSAGGPLAVSTPAATDTPQIADTPPWVGLRPDTATTHATQYWPVVDLRTRLIGGLVVQAATPSWASARVPAAHQAALDIEHVERAVTGLSLLSQAGSSSVALTMGLPLSLATVRNARACHDLRQLRLRSGWPSGTLRLDLDATAFVSEADAELVATLHGLRAAGWVLGLRDFGAGLASLASLDHAPFTTVALDASLGRGLAANTFAGAIVGATGLVAQSLGQDVIATGIDNEADAAAALRARCRWATGPLAGASMPASAVLRALTADGSASRLLH